MSREEDFNLGVQTFVLRYIHWLDSLEQTWRSEANAAHQEGREGDGEYHEFLIEAFGYAKDVIGSTLKENLWLGAGGELGPNSGPSREWIAKHDDGELPVSAGLRAPDGVKIGRGRVEQVASFPSHDEHGEPGWVTMRTSDRDALVNLARFAMDWLGSK